MTYPKDSMDIFNTIAILKHMHVFQSFCIAMSLVLFRHNKTPKVFCLTFGGHVKLVSPSVPLLFRYLSAG